MDLQYFKNTFKFSAESEMPLYLQLASYFKIQIQAGVLEPGSQMIPEKVLCEVLDISRTTVRQAMNLLVKEGLLVRYQGKGSFIADEKVKRSINYLYNFSEDMINMGITPSSLVLVNEIREIKPGDFKFEHLKLPGRQKKMFYLKRIRCADGEPLLVEETYIPYYLCEGIENYDFSKTSLYYVLKERYKLNLFRAKETLEAIVIDKNLSDLLGCKSNVAGYKISRFSYLESGFVFEYTSSITRADKCMFELDLYKETSDSKNQINIKRQVNL